MPSEIVVVQGLIVSHLPGYERASISEEKIRGYALNPASPKGKDKAVVFKSALGIEQEHSGYLREQIFQGLPETEAILANPETGWGQEWEVVVPVVGRNGNSRYVTTKWIVAPGSDPQPSLSTLYIEKSQRKLRDVAERRARQKIGPAP
jgi:hypothetical protein